MSFMNLAHRGASAYAPENTLAAFYKAVEVGANGIELDLRYSKDKVIVVIHDETVDRTTNGKGLVSDHSWDELSRLDAGSWFAPQYKGERLLQFREFLYFFSRKPLYFAIELKEKGLEEEVCYLLHDYDLADRSTITSFDYQILRVVREVDQKVNIGYLTNKIEPKTIQEIVDIQGQQICPQAIHLSEEDVALAKQHHLTVRAWGVRDRSLLNRVVQCGADGCTLDFPDQLNVNQSS